MKNRALILVIIVLAIIAIGYTGFWFYTSAKIEQAAKENIDRVIADLKDKAKIDVSYESVHVKGFPAQFVLVVKNLKLSDQQENNSNYSFEAAFLGNIEVKPSANYKDFAISLPMEFTSSEAKDGAKMELKTTFNQSPNIKIEFTESLIIAQNNWEDELRKKFKLFSYQDNGYKTSEINSGFEVYSAAKNEFLISSKKEENNLVTKQMKFSASAVKIGEGITDETITQHPNSDRIKSAYLAKKLGESNIDIEIIASGAEQEPNDKLENIKINQFNIKNTIFAITSNGEVIFDPSEPVPNGNIIINIQNIAALIGFCYDLFAANNEVPMINANLDSFKNSTSNFIRAITIDKVEETDSGKISILREKGKELKINGKTIPELAMLYQSSQAAITAPTIEENNEAAPEEEQSAPSAAEEEKE